MSRARESSPEPIKQLPCNHDAERAVLGAVILDNSILPTLGLVPEDFSLDSHRRIFKAMLDIDGGIDLVTLVEHMKRIGALSDLGKSPASYLAFLTEGLPGRGYNKRWVGCIRYYATLRRIIKACAQAQEEAWEAIDQPEEIVERLGIALKGLRRKNVKAT